MQVQKHTYDHIECIYIQSSNRVHDLAWSGERERGIQLICIIPFEEKTHRFMKYLGSFNMLLFEASPMDLIEILF